MSSSLLDRYRKCRIRYTYNYREILSIINQNSSNINSYCCRSKDINVFGGTLRGVFGLNDTKESSPLHNVRNSEEIEKAARRGLGDIAKEGFVWHLWLTDSCKLTPSHRLLLIQNTVIKIHKKKRTLPPAEAEAEAEAEGAMEQQALIGALNLVSRNLPLPPELFNTVSSIYHGSDTKPLPVDSSVPSLSPPPRWLCCRLCFFLTHSVIRRTGRCSREF